MQTMNFKSQLEKLGKQQRQDRHNLSRNVDGIKYTTILHQRRQALGLSLVEYCVADAIYNFSNAPKSKEIGGWCFASKQHIADCRTIGKKTADRAVSTLIDLGLVEKDPGTRFLRTTERWYLEVKVYQESKKT